MKGIYIILILVLFYGCSTLKRSSSHVEILTDSVSQNKETKGTVSKVDSVVNGKKDLSLKNTSDSQYLRKTIIREYYTDEFDFGTAGSLNENKYYYVQLGKSSAHEAHPVFAIAGRLLYKETEIEEKGSLNKKTEKKEKEESESSLKVENSSLSSRNDSSAVKKLEQKTETTKEREIIIPWWIWGVVGLIALFIILKLTTKI